MLIDKAFILAAVVFVGILCQWFAWRVKLPAILFLLFAGIITGPLTGWLNSDAIFGNHRDCRPAERHRPFHRQMARSSGT